MSAAIPADSQGMPRDHSTHDHAALGFFHTHDVDRRDYDPRDHGPKNSEAARHSESAPSDIQRTSHRFLLYGLLPGWVVPGLADWWLHKRTRIEHTSGLRESSLHALMMAEAAVPITLGLTARVNPLVLTVMGGAAAAHSATALWDVRLAVGEREVRPIEQHVHSFLEMLPLTALSYVACQHPEAVRATLRASRRPTDWRLTLKQPPLRKRYLASLAGIVLGGVALPYGEELLRCLRAAGSREPHPPLKSN